MKVLVAHNAYKLRGGEDSVVESEVKMLRDHGHDVETYFRHNDEIDGMGPAAAAVGAVWSAKTVDQVNRLFSVFRPDVLHVHNTFPLISPSLYWAAARHQVPVVQTLHNFRLFCPQAMFLRDGKICEDCMGTLPWRGVIRGCYRESRVQSAVLTGMLGVHRYLGTWERKVQRYIALNEFCRQKFIEGGLSAEKIVVKPNFVDVDMVTSEVRHGFLYVGRLSEEKGLGVLSRAVNISGIEPVAVVGDGPLARELAGFSCFQMLGSLRSNEVLARMRNAYALVMPSIWYETFGLVVIEAFACGTPVIASRLGSMASIVEDGVTGLLFTSGDESDLADKLKWARDHPQEMAVMGANARRVYDETYSVERNYQQLVDIYLQASQPEAAVA